MSFHPGQLVVCVDAREQAYTGPGHHVPGDMTGLTKGTVYTVREAGRYRYAGAEFDGVKVHEIVRPFDKYEGVSDCAYLASRFRPLSDDRIAIFRKLLAPQPERETA